MPNSREPGKSENSEEQGSHPPRYVRRGKQGGTYQSEDSRVRKAGIDHNIKRSESQPAREQKAQRASDLSKKLDEGGRRRSRGSRRVQQRQKEKNERTES